MKNKSVVIDSVNLKSRTFLNKADLSVDALRIVNALWKFAVSEGIEDCFNYDTFKVYKSRLNTLNVSVSEECEDRGYRINLNKRFMRYLLNENETSSENGFVFGSCSKWSVTSHLLSGEESSSSNYIEVNGIRVHLVKGEKRTSILTNSVITRAGIKIIDDFAIVTKRNSISSIQKIISSYEKFYNEKKISLNDFQVSSTMLSSLIEPNPNFTHFAKLKTSAKFFNQFIELFIPLAILTDRYESIVNESLVPEEFKGKTPISVSIPMSSTHKITDAHVQFSDYEELKISCKGHGSRTGRICVSTFLLNNVIDVEISNSIVLKKWKECMEEIKNYRSTLAITPISVFKYGFDRLYELGRINEKVSVEDAICMYYGGKFLSTTMESLYGKNKTRGRLTDSETKEIIDRALKYIKYYNPRIKDNYIRGAHMIVSYMEVLNDEASNYPEDFCLCNGRGSNGDSFVEMDTAKFNNLYPIGVTRLFSGIMLKDANSDTYLKKEVINSMKSVKYYQYKLNILPSNEVEFKITRVDEDSNESLDVTLENSHASFTMDGYTCHNCSMEISIH